MLGSGSLIVVSAQSQYSKSIDNHKFFVKKLLGWWTQIEVRGERLSMIKMNKDTCSQSSFMCNRPETP